MSNFEHLAKAAKDAEEKFFNRRAKIFLDAALQNCVDAFGVSGTIRLLGEHAEQLSEFEVGVGEYTEAKKLIRKAEKNGKRV